MIKLEDFKIKDNIFGIKSDFLTAIDILYFVDLHKRKNFIK